MKRQPAFLLFAVFVALTAAQTSASTPAAASPGAKSPAAAPPTQLLKPVPATDTAPFKPTHAFTVNDEKGLVLTCIAPEIETNPNTDLFKSCALAPGRTLDDVMHTFIQGIHYEQSEHQREREQWLEYLEEQAAQKSAQKR
jgi:hypothetical protein